ncbi:glycosyltransferase family 2 protein, partial [Clostridium sp.]|uniref:glycosyltransferase family 2 protein n=1 Tax=Clostridium sp. TaxID=1506 RepID=UPI002586D7CD
MSMSPKVFIVILNFNSFKDTKECLLSLQKLEYSNYEIIVVDNSSTDGSYEKLRTEFNTYNIIKSNENLGYANGNNIGIKYALENKADYICVLNNDVIVEDDFLDKIIKVMEDDKDIGLAGPCICKYHDKNIIQAMGANINLYNGLTQGKYKNYKYSDIPQKDIQVDYLGGACFVCRREVFEKIGFIPENYFLFFEETE